MEHSGWKDRNGMNGRPGVYHKTVCWTIFVAIALIVAFPENALAFKVQSRHFTPTRDRLIRESVTFSRSFELPTDVDAEKTKATCAHGILKRHLPKTMRQSVRKIEIENV